MGNVLIPVARNTVVLPKSFPEVSADFVGALNSVGAHKATLTRCHVVKDKKRNPALARGVSFFRLPGKIREKDPSASILFS
jgi:hypothetical protein